MDCIDSSDDRVLAELLRKHDSVERKWDLIVDEFRARTGLRKSKKWLKTRAKKLRERTSLSSHGEFAAHVEPATEEKSVSSESSQAVKIHVFEYSRHPQVLRDTLLNGEPLKACRQALSASGLSPELPSGPKLFVSPELFEPVLRAIQGKGFTSSHVIASDEFCDLVTAAVRSLPSRAQVREKSRIPFSIVDTACLNCGERVGNQPISCFQCHRATYCSRACQQRDWKQHRAICTPDSLGIPLLVKRSFLFVEIPSSLWSGQASSKQTASSADADPRKPSNPRACGPFSRRHLQSTDAGIASTAAIKNETRPPSRTGQGFICDHSFAIGDIVTVFGLVSDTGVNLNGQKGRVVGRDGASGRWCVELFDMQDSIKLVKGCNLRLLDEAGPHGVNRTDPRDASDAERSLVIGDTVEIFGLVSELGISLNGLKGRVVGRNDVNERWCVKLPHFVDTKLIKGCNLRLVNTRELGVLAEFLHYYVPFHITSPEYHGWNQISHAAAMFHWGCTVVYCNTESDADMVDARIRSDKKSVRCAATTDDRPIPFDRARIITLINFGVPPPLSKYKQRAERVFFITEDWPKSEPRGMIMNVVASSLSPPYMSLNMDGQDWSICGKPGPLPYASVFREDHPESLHDDKANTFEKPQAFTQLVQAGISFKDSATAHDEGIVSSNIDEWHVMLGHYAGERRHMYNTDWSWTQASPRDDPNLPETITMTTDDWLNPFGDSAAWRELDKVMESVFANIV